MTVDRSDACLGGLLNLNVLVQLVHFVHKLHVQNICHLILVGFSSLLLERTFARQCLFRTTLVTRFQIERVFLDILNRRSALSIDSPSWILTSANLSPPPHDNRSTLNSTQFTGAEYARLPQVDDEKNGLIFISNY